MVEQTSGTDDGNLDAASQTLDLPLIPDAAVQG